LTTSSSPEPAEKHPITNPDKKRRRNPEVDESDRTRAEKVLRLEIAVSNALAVQISNRLEDLLDDD